MTAPIILAVSAAAVLGLLVGWLLASSRANRLQSDLSGNAAQLTDAQKQLETARGDTERLRRDLANEQSLRTRAQADLENQRANLEEQRRILAEAETKLREVFDALAAKALHQSSEQFLQLAQQRFGTLQQEASGDLSRRQESIKVLVEPLQQRLSDLQVHLSQLESKRESAYGDLRGQVQLLASTSRDLQKETGALVNTLRQPQVKGRWGELTLRRTVELTGMTAHCDFYEQVSTDTPAGRMRPDMIIHLPRNAQVVVDAKVPLHGMLRVAAAQTDAEREAGLAEHVRLVREHVSQLSSKEYWKQFEPSPGFVLMFLPGESFFQAALEKDPTLYEEAIEHNVILASPGNLIAFLKSAAYGWHQEMIAENAQEISDLGRDLYDRVVTFLEHMQKLRGSLQNSSDSFNQALGSLESRLIPGARKLKEKGIQSSSDLPEIEPLDTGLRAINPALTDGET